MEGKPNLLAEPDALLESVRILYSRIVVAPLCLLENQSPALCWEIHRQYTVSYTHLDVYKRQHHERLYGKMLPQHQGDGYEG